MSKTKIPWCDFTINPVKGLCPMACPSCYARRRYKRFKWIEELMRTLIFAVVLVIIGGGSPFLASHWLLGIGWESAVPMFYIGTLTTIALVVLTIMALKGKEIK